MVSGVASHPHAHRASGFTLPELLSVVAIVAILASVAAPAFSSMVAGARARSASSELYAALSRARSEAIKRNAEVTLAPAMARQWQSGWSIAAAAGSKLEDHPAVKGATLTGPDSVVFLPNGRIKGGFRPAFDILIGGDSQHRCVRVDLSGRPNQTKSTC